MEGLRTSLILLIVAILHQAPSFTALDAHKVLHIPEKIIGGVIDIVQNHKNKPSQQASYQQSVQTQTSFSQQGNPQGTSVNVPQQPWTGPAYQGQGQFLAQGQYGNTYGTASPVYPTNTGPVNTGTPGSYPNPGPYQPQQGFAQSQNQGQYQNFQNQGQFQNQNQQSSFQGQGQSQNQNQNGQYQSGQYGSGNFQGTEQFGQSNGGNFQGQNVGQTNGGNFQSQNVGQTNGGNYHGQNVGQTSGNYQTGQYLGNPNGPYNPNQQGGQFSQNQQTGQNQQSGYYHGSNQQSSSQSNQNYGQNQGSSGSHGNYGGSQFGGNQSSSSNLPNGPCCVCQAWTKPPASQVLHDEPPKPEKIEKKADTAKPTV